MNHASRRILAALCISLTVLASTGVGQSLPPVNLGFTSFVDGAPPAGPGWYFQQYFQYFANGELKDNNGDTVYLPVPGGASALEVDAFVSLTQLIYQSDQALFGTARWGMDLIVPVADLSTSIDAPLANETGLGDILVGPFLQWDPIMGENGPIMMNRIELQTIFPTGRYDKRYVLNPGSNHFSFNPYWAATVFPMPGWSITWRVHYLWNAKNNDVGYGPDFQPGQAFHINFATSYEVIEKQLRLGLNGYYLAQITESKIGGRKIKNSEETVFGIGPGALFSFSQDDHIFLNLYIETMAENRPEGWRLNLRWTHHF